MNVRRLAWPLFGLWVALTATASVLQLRAGGIPDAVLAPALGVLAWVGALVWVRRQGNLIGPLLLTLAILVVLSIALEGAYASYDDDPNPPLAIRTLVALSDPLGDIWFMLVGVVLPLLFPTGRVPSPRWRAVLWAGVGTLLLSALAEALGTRRLDFGEQGGFVNPLAVPWAAGDVMRAAGEIAEPVFSVVVICAIGSVVVRLRRSSGIERQQLKWIAYTFAVLLCGLLAAALGEMIGWDALGNVGWSVFLLGVIVGMPLAVGTAILRHRLYDIDLVIRRTLVYGALTVTLGAAYLALVLLIGLTVGRSGFATAASTLTVAALFGPARARIQAVVDRRFNRRRYDAARTLEAFGAQLLDELDLEAVAADVRAIVRDTVQPAHVSLWLKGGR